VDSVRALGDNSGVFTAATLIIVGFFAVVGGVNLQRFRQSLQDRADLKARLERNGKRVRREYLWAGGTLLVIWIAYQVIERGGLR